MGRVGKSVIEKATAFGMEISAFDVHWDKQFADRYRVSHCQSTEDFFKRSDIVSLHCSLDNSNFNLINEQSLASMKDGVMIINCARGELVNSA